MLNVKNEIKFIIKGTILPSKIFNIIKKVYGELVKISAKNIYFKDNYIYYINKEKIIVGAFQKKALFLPIYICTYNSIDLMKGEKEKMFQSNINEYIKERHCSGESDFQPLKDIEEKEIGSLIILFQNDPNFKIEKKPKNKNNKNNNNQGIKSQIIDDDNKLISEKSYQQKENELININNKLNTRIKNLEQELEKKNEQLSTNKNDLEKIKNINKLLLQKQNEDKNKLKSLENENSQLKNDKNNLISIQNKVQGLESMKNDLLSFDNKFNELNQRYNKLIDENKDMENQIKKIAKEKENLIKNLKESQSLIISQKDLINQNNNQINILK